ncbi:FAR-RED ELONGATED HYPOCOTYL 3-like protein [Drosera capensis]
MEKALEEVIPEVRHGLCTWHLMQNGIKHLGNVMKDVSPFLTDFKKLTYGCVDELQFEDDWKRLLANYDVEGNSWLERTYLLKKKWAKCYMKTAVALGMRSTQLSESLNGVMKKYMKCHLDMTSFLKQFERVVDDIRYNEKQAVYHAIEKLPELKIRMHPLLQQMENLYTPAVFKKFQSQWEKSKLVCIKFLSQSDTVSEYVVTSVDGERHYLVKVLDAMDILQLPQLYIVKRWTRDARDVTCEPSIDEFHKRSHLDISDRYRELCPDLIKMATIAADFEEGFICLKKYVNNGLQLLDDLRRKHSHEVVVKLKLRVGGLGRDDWFKWFTCVCRGSAEMAMRRTTWPRCLI